MKRTLSMLAVVALGFTACTDQPPSEQPSPSVTQTVTDQPTEIPTPDRLTRMVASILEHPAPADIATDTDALHSLNQALVLGPTAEQSVDPEADSQGCPSLQNTGWEVAVYGATSTEKLPDDDEPEDTSGLAAIGFATPEDAAEFTTQLHTSVEDAGATCDVATYEILPLTHHTDVAFEILLTGDTVSSTSIVVVATRHWAILHVSSPPSDVALSLTLIDQLDEMLR